MNKSQTLRDLAALPAEAQRLVADLVVFLKRQQKTNGAAPERKSKPIGKAAFVGMWGKRRDLRDSRAWVRGLRKADWVVK